jgi:cytochrome c-type biogenesis protein
VVDGRGAATVLVLVAIATAAAGTALTRRLSVLARHSTHITAAVLILTGAYLAWYWYPAATGATAPSAGLVSWSATATTLIGAYTTTIAVLAVVAVLAVAAGALSRRLRRRGRATTHVQAEISPSAQPDCCAPDTVEDRTDTAASR